MAKIFFDVFLKFVVSVANIGLAPVNSLLVNVFPNLTSYMNDFSSVLTTYVSPIFGWFIYLIPPKTRGLVGIYLGTVATLYVVGLTIQGIIKIFKLIKNIKIW